MKKTVMLPLETAFFDFKAVFNVAAIRYDGGVVLVDVGFASVVPKLEESMAAEGLKLSDVKKIIITHHDGDHMGGLKALIDKYPDIEVMCSADQVPFVTGKEKPLRLQLAEKRYAECTDQEERKELEEDMKRLSDLQTVNNVTIVKDKQILSDCGLEIVEVAGHMPGHLCVYVPEDKCLITGDALTARGGVLCPPDSNFTLDMPSAIKSLEKLLKYDIDNVICYHGGLVTGDIKLRLKGIMEKGK